MPACLTETDFTPWFEGRVKPVRSGVYMTRWKSIINPGVTEDGFSYWDQKLGLWGWMSKMQHQVVLAGSEQARQDKEWAGLTRGAWVRITEGLGS